MARVRPGGSAPHVLVDDVDDPVLSADDLHHLCSVRRLRDAAELSVTDGAGAWRWCRLGDAGDGVIADGEVHRDPPPDPVTTVAFALTKGDKPELVVQKLTEIGIDRIVPFLAARSVVRWDAAKAERHHERLVRIARGALMQSRRTWMPVVEPVTTFDEVIALPGAIRADRDGEPLGADHRVVLIGPEGGWDDAERIGPAVGMGDTVLRAETAAIVAATLLIDRRRR